MEHKTDEWLEERSWYYSSIADTDVMMTQEQMDEWTAVLDEMTRRCKLREKEMNENNN